MAAKKKQRRERKRPTDKLDCLYLALADYIESRGGKLLVTGPVRAVSRGHKYCYTIEIDCCGRLSDSASDAP